MRNYLILLDNWEADVNLDVPYLVEEAHVAGQIVRLNDMRGGHHMDELFPHNWEQAQLFPVQMLYFVYNPWVDGVSNWRWLNSHVPSDYGQRRVHSDIEVKYDGYPATTYGRQVAEYYNYLAAKYARRSTYTGGWFLPIVSPWPGGSYWWGRYPYAFYPKDRTEITWTQLHQMIANANYSPDPNRQCPGIVELWQFTADRLILPGFGGRACDMNIFIGTPEQLRVWSGCEGLPLPPPEPTFEEKIQRLWDAHPELHI